MTAGLRSREANGVHEINKEQLRDLLHQQAKAVSDEAVQAGKPVSAEQVDALRRLAQLVEICDAVQPPPRKLLPIIAGLGVTLLIVSILLIARVSETEIELDLTVSEVSFVSPKLQVLTDVMKLSALGVSGLQEIQLPRSRGRAAQRLDASEGAGSAVHLSTPTEGEGQGTITLATLMLPAQTRVWVRATGVPQQYLLSLRGDGLEIPVHVNGSIPLALPGTTASQLDFKSPKSVLLRPGSNVVDLSLVFLSSAQGAFSPQFSANELALFRIDEFPGADRTVIRHVSTVLSGTLYLEALNGQEQVLRPGEGIRFEDSEGEIRVLQLLDDHIALKFHGRVRGMSTGSIENRRNLMPTYLEWLSARHGFSLLWGTALYLFGLFLTVLRWWRVTI